MHVTSSPIDWYAARAAGIAAYVLLSLVVVVGTSMAAKLPGRRWRGWPMFAVEDVHRAGGLLVGSFVAIHVVTIAIDSFLPFSLTQLVVPLAAAYRPLWVALGIVAAELLVALAITNHYRDRIPYRLWRRAHYANLVVWLAATVHGLGSGTDRSAGWMIAIYAVSVAGVTAAVTWRISASARLRSPLRPVGLCSVAGLSALLVVGTALGPLRTHPRPWNAANFQDRLTGQILQETAATRAIVSMSGKASGVQNVLVRADLLVAPGRVSSTRLQLEFLPSGAICTGPVTRVGATSFTGNCAITPDDRRHVVASWRLGAQASLRGTLTVTRR